MLYDKKIQDEFKNKQPIEILEKYLYRYRENVNNENFHFLIGISFMKMGQLREAKIAFEKAIEVNPDNNRNKIFLINTFIQAQHIKEATELICSLDTTTMSAPELLAFMEVKKYLNMPLQQEKELLLADTKENNIDKKIFSIIAYAFCDEYEEANNLAKEIEWSEMTNVTTYFLVLEEFYKLKIDKKIIFNHFDYFSSYFLTKLNQEELSIFLKSAFGCEYLEHCTLKKRLYIFNYVLYKFSKNIELVSQVYILKYNLAEKANDEMAMGLTIKALKKLKNKNENVLLCLCTDDFKHFDTTNKKQLKKRLEQLIQKDQKNEKYRKLYFDLLMKSGNLKGAEEVTKATVLMRMKTESSNFDIIRSFYSFYYTRKCIFDETHPDNKDCPLCFGSGYMPIVKTIMFGHSPRQIYTEANESKTIEVDEKTLKAIVDWQPINIPSQIVGTYLNSLGAYETMQDIPDVLVPGQTYIFIKMKTATYKRLAEEGYSLDQIDPYFNLLQGIQKTKPNNKLNEMFSQEDKELNINNLPVSANDFVIEIIHAISSEK